MKHLDLEFHLVRDQGVGFAAACESWVSETQEEVHAGIMALMRYALPSQFPFPVALTV
jgi:hypothetical protein